MAKKGICINCGRTGSIEDHHIIPFRRYHSDKRTISVCPNCHKDYHNLLPYKRLTNEQYESFFMSWVFGLFKSKDVAA